MTLSWQRQWQLILQSSFTELWIIRWTALCVSSGDAASGFCGLSPAAGLYHGSVTAGHLYSFIKKAAASLTTGRANRPFQREYAGFVLSHILLQLLFSPSASVLCPVSHKAQFFTHWSAGPLFCEWSATKSLPEMSRPLPGGSLISCAVALETMALGLLYWFEPQLCYLVMNWKKKPGMQTCQPLQGQSCVWERRTPITADWPFTCPNKAVRAIYENQTLSCTFSGKVAQVLAG